MLTFQRGARQTCGSLLADSSVSRCDEVTTSHHNHKPAVETRLLMHPSRKQASGKNRLLPVIQAI